MDEPNSEIKNEELSALAAVLTTAVKKMLRVKGAVRMLVAPEVKYKLIVQFRQRMRIDALEKFGERTVFSAVHFYIDKGHLDHHRAIGSLIVYIPVTYISKFLWMLDYPRIEEDDDAAVLDGCGTLTNLIAGYFVQEMTALGYAHLEMSHFESYINTAVNGIEFSSDQDVKCELSFEIKGEKKLVAELTMGHVPRY